MKTRNFSLLVPPLSADVPIVSSSIATDDDVTAVVVAVLSLVSCNGLGDAGPELLSSE